MHAGVASGTISASRRSSIFALHEDADGDAGTTCCALVSPLSSLQSVSIVERSITDSNDESLRSGSGVGAGE